MISPSSDIVNEGNKNEDWNLLSYVIVLEYKTFVIAFGGDASDSAWENIYKYAVDSSEIKQLLSKVNIFKVSHHGRNTSYCGADILNLMRPTYIVISKGSVPGEQSAYGNYYNWCDGNVQRLFLTSKGTVIADFNEQTSKHTIDYKK